MDILLISFYFLALINSIAVAEDTLEMVHVLYRHGDRNPVRSYPTDPYKNETIYWPEGFGQLTKKGKEMEYKLGGWLRRRYNNFIGEVFNVKEVKVVSTDYDRTLMSAQCVLASFFYPDLEHKFNKSLSWLPTPIHTSPNGTDKLLNVDATCPRVANEIVKMNNIPYVKKFWKDYESLAHYLTNHSGSEINNISSIGGLYDILKIEAEHNLTLPSWTNGYMEEMKKVADFSFVISAFTKELKRLRGGPLLGEISKHMTEKAAGGSTKKLYMYSAHDMTVAVLLTTMGVFNKLLPPYSSTVLVELHNSDGERYVKMFYQNDSTFIEPPHSLVVPLCTEVCPLNIWKKLMEDYIPEDWEKECHILDPLVEVYYIRALSATILCCLMAVILLALLMYIHCHLKKTKSETPFYEALPSYET